MNIHKKHRNTPSTNLHNSDLIIVDLHNSSSTPIIPTDNSQLIKDTSSNKISLGTRNLTYPENLSSNALKISEKDDLKVYDDYNYEEILKAETCQKDQSQTQHQTLLDENYIHHDASDDRQEDYDNNKKKIPYHSTSLNPKHPNHNDQEGNYYIKTSHNQWIAYKLEKDFDNNPELANVHDLKFNIKYFIISFIAHILYFFLFGPCLCILNKCFGKYLLTNMAFTRYNIDGASLNQHCQYLMIIILLVFILLFDTGSYRLFEFVMFLLVIYFRIICISTKYGYISKAYLYEFTRRKLRLEETRNWFLLNNWRVLKDNIIEYELQTTIMKLNINYIGYYFKFLNQDNTNSNGHQDNPLIRHRTIPNHNSLHDINKSNKFNSNNNSNSSSSRSNNSIQNIKDYSSNGLLLDASQHKPKKPHVQNISKPRVMKRKRLILSKIKSARLRYRVLPLSTIKPKENNKKILSSYSINELFSINEANYQTHDSIRARMSRSIIAETIGEVEAKFKAGEGEGIKPVEKEGARAGESERAITEERESRLIKDSNNTSIIKDIPNDKVNHTIESNRLFNPPDDKIEITRDKIWSYRFYQFSKRYLTNKIDYHDHGQNEKSHQHHRYKHKSGYKLAKEIIKKSRILNTMKPFAFAILLSIIRGIMPFIYRAYYHIPIFGENDIQCMLIIITFLLNFMLYAINFLLWSQGLIDLRRRLFYLEQLTNILHVKNEGSNNFYPMINIFDPVTLKSWGNLRQILCDFGCRFYANSSFTLAITCITYIFIIMLLIIQLFGIVDLNFDILMIVVFKYETIVVITLLFCYMAYGSKINQHFNIHKKILKENKNIIIELDELKYIYFKNNLNNINNSVFVEGIKYLKVDLEYDKYPEKFQEKLELRFQSLINIINNLMEGLDIDQDTSPYEILGFTVNENLIKATAVGLMSLVSIFLQKEIGLIQY